MTHTPDGRPGSPDSGRSIVLIGAPGAGKSTVGRQLARRLRLDFVDVDALIEAETGTTIAEIFADQGEPAFRALERAYTTAALESTGVVALGGGAVTSAEVRSSLSGHRVIWLRVGLAAAVRRVGLDTARPLLLGNVRGQLLRLMTERAALYAEVATDVVDTDDLDAPAVVARILEGDRHG